MDGYVCRSYKGMNSNFHRFESESKHCPTQRMASFVSHLIHAFPIYSYHDPIRLEASALIRKTIGRRRRCRASRPIQVRGWLPLHSKQ